MSPYPKVFRPAAAFALVLLSSAALARAQSSGCAPTIGTVTATLPNFSGTVNGVLAMPVSGRYLYVMTQYGIARGSLADPSNPGPFVLAQIGHKSLQGLDNGGKVPAEPAGCDCWQGGTTIDAAEASDGSARMISDFDNRFGGRAAEVATADSSGNVAFGQQIDLVSRLLGSRVAALYLSSGKYIGYFPYSPQANQGGIAVVDVTSTTGSPSAGNAIEPMTTLAWGSGTAVILKSAHLGGKYLLVGGVNKDKKIRIAEVDPASGIPTEKSSIATTGAVSSLSVAAVNGRTFIFSAEGTSGVEVYEYANGALTFSGTLSGGNFSEVVVTGGLFPLVFAENVVSGSETYIEVFDSNWVTQGGQPRHAAHLRQAGAPQNYIGKGFQAFVSGNNAYVYRIQPNTGAGESLVSTTKLDVSCISIDPTSVPIANSTATNLSAAARLGAERTINYYGDKWEIQDASASSSSPPADGLDQIEWDWNYTTAFGADTGWSALPYNGTLALGGTSSDVKPAYFPCNPSNGGNLQSGANCATSLGIGGAAPSKSYSYAERTHNGNGWSGPSVSTPIPFVPPQAIIAGLDTSKTPAQLLVLSGQGVADATASQGNLAEATVQWKFDGQLTATKLSTTVPIGATTFSLTITYPGGYTATQTGNVVQVDLVPDFTPTTGTITVGGSLTITNKMQKASTVSITSVEYAWDGALYTALASTFNSVNGTAQVPAPPIGTNHSLKLRYNYTKSGVQQNPATVAHAPFNVTTSLTVTVAGPSSGRTNSSVSFTATAIGASPSVTFTWCFEACSLFPTFTAGPATNSHIFRAAGTYTVVVKATDGVGGPTGTGSTAVVISGGGGPPPPTPTPNPGGPTPTPNPGGGGTPAAAVSGPTNAVASQPVSFSVIVNGGTPPYVYAWRWGDNALAGYFNGPQTNSYTYVNPGTYTVSVRVTDSKSKIATASQAIIITSGGKPLPNANFSVSGATLNALNGQYETVAGQPVSFTAVETHATAYAWNFGDGATATGVNVTHTFGSSGGFTVALSVTGDETTTSGTSTSSKKFAIDAPKFAALAFRDVAHDDTGDGTWLTDVTVSNNGTTPITITPVFKSYADLGSIQGSSIDITTLGFDGSTVTKVTVPPGGLWSQADVVGALSASGKGNLFLKYDGGPAPVATARVYFAPKDTSLGAYGIATQPYQVGALGQIGVESILATQSQKIIGLRSDDEYRFSAKLYNSAGVAGYFTLSATDQNGNEVVIPDQFKIVGIGPYQGLDVSDEQLGLTDPTLRYVLTAEPVSTGAKLLSEGAVIDRVTKDQIAVADDGLRPTPSGGNVVFYLPGVSRIDTGGAHWRTSVSILNSGAAPRGVLVEYLYTVGGGGAEKVAQNFFAVDPGKLLAFDDISAIFPSVADLTADAGTAGVLRITHPADADSDTSPLLIAARNYDDRTASNGGTAGTQIQAYDSNDAIGLGAESVFLPGGEQDDLFRTTVGFFALDDVVTQIRVSAIDATGTEVGFRDDIALNNGGPSHWTQFGINNIPNLPVGPVTLKVQVIQGGRIGTYLTTVDQKSLDPARVKGTPEN